MTFFNNADWIGYLAENTIQKCISLTLVECPGCKDGMKSDILHLHSQLSLLEKIQNHFETARGQMLESLNTFYKEIESKLPHSSERSKDMSVYCSIGRFFLLTISAQALYYGRYVNECNHSLIHEVLGNKKKIIEKKNVGKKNG